MYRTASVDVELQARPARPFSSTLTVRSGCGDIATMTVDARREAGGLSFAYDRYAVHREAPGAGGFVLEGPEGIFAMACKPTVRPWFEVAFGGRRLLVEPSSMLRRAYVVTEGVKDRGAVRRRMPPFGRGIEAELTADVPVAVQVFLAWLVLVAVRSPTATWACREPVRG